MRLGAEPKRFNIRCRKAITQRWSQDFRISPEVIASIHMDLEQQKSTPA